jgi:hypothetical protein
VHRKTRDHFDTNNNTTGCLKQAAGSSVYTQAATQGACSTCRVMQRVCCVGGCVCVWGGGEVDAEKSRGWRCRQAWCDQLRQCSEVNAELNPTPNVNPTYIIAPQVKFISTLMHSLLFCCVTDDAAG